MSHGLGSYLYRAYQMPMKNDRLCYVILCSMITCFALAESAEVLMKEDIYNGFDNTVSRIIIPQCSWDEPPYSRGQVNWYLVCASYLAFDNARIIPTMISFGLIPMTFLLARKLANNMVALVSALALMLTPTFLIFDTSAAFAQTWSMLFLGSLYFARKRPYLSIPLYIGSVFAKAIPIIWLPVILYLVLSSGFPKREKTVTCLVLCVFTVLVSGYMVYFNIVVVPLPNIASLHDGINITWGSFRWSEELLLFLPLAAAFHIMFQKRFNLKREPVMLAMYSVGSIFFISSFTTGNYFPYRIIPNLIIMLYCYAGMFHDVMEWRLSKYGGSR